MRNGKTVQQCVYDVDSTWSCWHFAVWVESPTLNILEAEGSVNKGKRFVDLTCLKPSAKSKVLNMFNRNHCSHVIKLHDTHDKRIRIWTMKSTANCPHDSSWWSVFGDPGHSYGTRLDIPLFFLSISVPTTPPKPTNKPTVAGKDLLNGFKNPSTHIFPAI